MTCSTLRSSCSTLESSALRERTLSWLMSSNLRSKSSSLDLTLSSSTDSIEVSALRWPNCSDFCLRASFKDRMDSSKDALKFWSCSLALSTLQLRISTLVLSARCWTPMASIWEPTSLRRARIESPVACNCVDKASNRVLSAFPEETASSLELYLSVTALSSARSTFCCIATPSACTFDSTCSTRPMSALFATLALLCFVNFARSSSARSTQLVRMLSATAFSRKLCICFVKF
mmetsp:Transcript_9794/g.20745  ORF Transcript_9794/g.20745 Transcript_9794/m.20745 type:complete len:233 (+) Transcript_9794:732-1430(+)